MRVLGYKRPAKGILQRKLFKGRSGASGLNRHKRLHFLKAQRCD